jgi:hypothetical protein
MDLHHPIQILLVEDSETDGTLLTANLKAHGLVFNLTRVEDLEPLRIELAKPGWDILLTYFNLPGIPPGIWSTKGSISPAFSCLSRILVPPMYHRSLIVV